MFHQKESFCSLVAFLRKSIKDLKTYYLWQDLTTPSELVIQQDVISSVSLFFRL